MNYRDAVLHFVSKFPEFKSDLDLHIKELDEILPYVFFPQVFHDHIEDKIKANVETDWIKKFFDFLEMMAVREETEITDLLSLTFLDDMRDDPAVLETSIKLCGKATTKHLEDILRFYGQLPPLVTESLPILNRDSITRKKHKMKSKDIGSPHRNQNGKK